MATTRSPTRSASSPTSLTAFAAWFYLRHASRAEAARMTAPRIPACRRRSCARRCCRFRVRVFGPLANLFLWAFAERWYLPFKLPVSSGLRSGRRVFRPRGDAMASLATSVCIACSTVAVALAVSIPAGYALARLKLPLRTAIMLAVPAAAGVPDRAGLHQRRARLLQLGLTGTIPGVVLVHAAHGLVSRSGSRRRPSRVDATSNRRRATSAPRRRCFRTVTLPLAAPGLMASAIFVFLESLDEFTGTFFVGVPDVTTLPLLLYNASMGGNYQIASITALIYSSPRSVHDRHRALPAADVLANVGR